MTTVDHGFNLKRIRAKLDRESWEDEYEPGQQVRRVYLGTVFNLTPSGKYYLPFACSNVDACPTCKGKGRVTPRRLKRRTIKKWQGRHAATMRRFDGLMGETGAERTPPTLMRPYRPQNKQAAFAFIDRQPKRFRMRYLNVGTECTACNGTGSREAYLDELWNEAATEALQSIGASLESGEGDPCDLFAVEYRDAAEGEDDNAEETAETADA
jgi:hypothetical protein